MAQLLAPEREKLLHLPEALHQRVVGQDQAVDAVADSIQRQGLHGAATAWTLAHADPAELECCATETQGHSLIQTPIQRMLFPRHVAPGMPVRVTACLGAAAAVHSPSRTCLSSFQLM